MTIETGERQAPYYLTEAFIGGRDFEINSDMYATLSEALTMLVSAMEIEESFQVFAQSFLRFEKDLLDIAFEFAYANTHCFGDEEFLDDARYRFNVSIITILTSFKTYDDQCSRVISSIGSPELERFNFEIRARAFDTHLSYRICNALRNYAQHRALPLTSLSIGGKANFDFDDAGRTKKLDTGFNVAPWLNVAELKASSQCKAGLKRELSCLAVEKIDMKWLMRSFAGAMCERHAALRAFLKPEIEAANQQITTGYDFARNRKGSEPKFLELHGGGESRHMRSDLGTKVLRAFQTYTSLRSAELLYITSQIEPKAFAYSGK